MSDDNEKKEPESNPKFKGSKGGEKGGERIRQVKPRGRNPGRQERTPNRFTSEATPAIGKTDTSASSDLVYSAGVLSAVTPLLVQQPLLAYRKIGVVMGPSALFDLLAEGVFRYVRIRSVQPTPLVSLENIRLAFRYALAMRIAQVTEVSTAERPAHMQYPAFLGPLLAQVGRYIHPTAGYELIPQFDLTDPLMATVFQTAKQGAQDVVIRVVKPDTYDETIGLLRTWGMTMNVSLPVNVLVVTDDFFRFDEAQDNRLVASGDFSASPGTVLNRSLLHCSSLAEVYGYHRTIYAALDSFRVVVDKLATDAFQLKPE